MSQDDLGRAPSILDRFMSFVRKDDECWYFEGAKDAEGYGLFWMDGKMHRAHRVAWSLATGVPFPDGKVARHLCGNPSCVRARHIEPGSQSQNRKDTVALGRDRYAARTQCEHGHELSGHNLIVKQRARGAYRACRTCKQKAQAKYRAKRGAARV